MQIACSEWKHRHYFSSTETKKCLPQIHVVSWYKGFTEVCLKLFKSNAAQSLNTSLLQLACSCDKETTLKQAQLGFTVQKRVTHTELKTIFLNCVVSQSKIQQSWIFPSMK